MDSVRKLVELIKSKGLTATISTFTHLENVISGNPDLVGRDRPYPQDKQLWQQNFSKSILQWAQFSQDVGAFAFAPFEDVTQHLLRDPELTTGWLKLLDDIKAIYKGKLTTTWWSPGEGDSITAIPASIIAKLDYIGVGFFPELTKNSNASTQELIDAYYSDVHGNNVIKFLKGISDTFNKPIWITDKAFHSFDGSASDEVRVFTSSIPLVQDLEEQARLYESFLRVMTLEGGDWMQGVSFQNFNNIKDTVDIVARFVNGPLSESPQGKPAYDVMSDWFKGAKQSEGLSLALDTSITNLSLQGGYHHDRITGGLGNDYLSGGAGNDILTGGTSQATSMNVHKVDVLLRGVKSQGVSPVVRIVDESGNTVAEQEVTAPWLDGQTTATGAPTRMTFYVAAQTPKFNIEVTNWASYDAGPTGNRYVRIDSIAYNDKPLSLDTSLLYVPGGTFPQQVGRIDSVHGGKFVITPPGNVQPTVLSFSDNDRFSGGAGNDLIDGGAGFDVALYSSARANFEISAVGNQFRVTDKTGAEGVDTLSSIERLTFSDHNVALDLNGKAGDVARILGIVFGRQAVQNKEYVGIGLSLMDGGMGVEELIGLALQTALGPNASHAAVVNLLYSNAAGAPPPAADLNQFVALLDNGTYTQTSLAVMAANHELNAANIGLVGLLQTGLDYLP